MKELKPCPFCGCEVEAVDSHFAPWVRSGYFGIIGNHSEECVFNLLSCKFFYESYDSKEEAIKAWNRRANNV